jgi:hypothetical protein
MRKFCLGLVLLAGIALIPSPTRAADVDLAAMTTAAREVNRQINFLQELFGTNDQLSQINGLFKQTMDFQTSLSEFRQSVNAKASAEQLAVSFDTVDRNLGAILGEVNFLEKDLPSLKLVCNKLRLAEHNLHFAVFGGDDTPGRKNEKLLRQTMAQQALVESLANNVTWVFSGRESRAGWKDDLAAVQKSLVALQGVEQKKGATADEIKEQFGAADKTWGKLIQRYNDAKPQDQVLLKSFVAMVDQGFSRVAPLAGVNDRKATVTDGYSD